LDGICAVELQVKRKEIVDSDYMALSARSNLQIGKNFSDLSAHLLVSTISIGSKMFRAAVVNNSTSRAYHGPFLGATYLTDEMRELHWYGYIETVDVWRVL
jgi:hypothetical protein